MGVVIDGCPAGVKFQIEELEKALARRRPGANALVSARSEEDKPKILSGVFEGKTLGTPIAIVVENKDTKSESYSFNQDGNFRAGHADDLWRDKFAHWDWRGGGRASGRETLSRVIVGSVAEMFLKQAAPELRVRAFSSEIAGLRLNSPEIERARKSRLEIIDSFPARFPGEAASEVEALLKRAKDEGKSYGGVAEVFVEALPRGLGEPVFDKIKARLASAMMGIGATCGVEFGAGFSAARSEGSVFHGSGETQQYGGVRGGITTGEALNFRVAFKPTSSVLDVAKKGRHDPCIVPRAVPVVEAMTWWVLADMLLLRRLNSLESFK
jgi:chorismate synthase